LREREVARGVAFLPGIAGREYEHLENGKGGGKYTRGYREEGKLTQAI